jgi:hypothetical protein
MFERENFVMGDTSAGLACIGVPCLSSQDESITNDEH